MKFDYLNLRFWRFQIIKISDYLLNSWASCLGSETSSLQIASRGKISVNGPQPKKPGTRPGFNNGPGKADQTNWLRPGTEAITSSTT